jgi:uncharacterized membrane protein HdeD (DUF308 family)
MEFVWISSPQNQRSSGVVALIIGIIILLFAPFVTSLIGTLLSAIVLVISIVMIISGVMMRGIGLGLPLILLGILGFCLGIITLVSPDLAVSVLGIFLGVWMFLLGAGQLAFASGLSSDRLYYVLALLGGTLTVIIGLFLLISPVQGMQIMVFFFGCYLLVYGLLNLFRPRYAY